MELGSGLESLPEVARIEDNIIKGCQSKVWLIAEEQDGKVHYMADSNTDITKGLISLLLRVLNDRVPEEILNAKLDFVERIGMGSIIGSQRSNGFASMIKQIKLFAIAIQSNQTV
jgi:cysteine desulfuration protein SufE